MLVGRGPVGTGEGDARLPRAVLPAGPPLPLPPPPTPTPTLTPTPTPTPPPPPPTTPILNQLNALRGIAPAADPNAPTRAPTKGLDLSGLFNASGINASALVNATAVAAREAKLAAEAAPRLPARAAGGRGVRARGQRERCARWCLGGIHKQVMGNASSFDLKSAVTLRANMSAITPEVLLAMRQKKNLTLNP